MRIYQDDGSEEACDIVETGEGTYIIAGSNNALYQDRDVYLMEIDGQGDVLWSRNYGGASDDVANALFLTEDSCYVLAGCTSSFGAGASDFYLMKTGYSGAPNVPPTPDSSVPRDYVLHAVFPNPFNAQATIRFDVPEAGHLRLIVYDILGREVARLVNDVMPVGYHSVIWNAGATPSGVYFMLFEGRGFTHSKKVLLLK
jgi:hypothetical protein